MTGGSAYACIPRTRYLLLGLLGLAPGCAGWPAPIVIHETPHEAVWLKVEPRLGSGHDHPAVVSPVQIATALNGLRVTERDRLGLGALTTKDEDAKPPFTASEIASLAPYLSEALRKASPRDVATFYLVSSDPKLGRLITSGGLFVRGGRLIVILANARTPPSASPYEGMAYEIDNRDEPLLPVARYRFIVSFVPAEVRVPAGDVSYVDPARVVALDLGRLAKLSDAKPGEPEKTQ